MTSPSSTQTRTIRLGVIGTDSSHLSAFTSRIADLNQAGQTACRVTAFYTDGRHHMPEAEVQGWMDEAQARGAAQADSLDAMLDAVDGVMVLGVAGSLHLDQARPALERGLPTYIDKPLANTLEDARTIVELVQKHGSPCYSASSLRFAAELGRLDRDQLGDIVAVDAFGPGELHDLMPGVLFYGVHTVEMVDAILGPGVKQVRAEHTPDRDTVQLRYADGRYASLRMERVGAYDFGAVVQGTQATASFIVDFDGVYDRLVQGLTDFFEHGRSPVPLSQTLENIAVMTAANRSSEQGGVWLDLE